MTAHVGDRSHRPDVRLLARALLDVALRLSDELVRQVAQRAGDGDLVPDPTGRQVVGGAVARPLGTEAVRWVGDEHDGGARVVPGLEQRDTDLPLAEVSAIGPRDSSAPAPARVSRPSRHRARRGGAPIPAPGRSGRCGRPPTARRRAGPRRRRGPRAPPRHGWARRCALPQGRCGLRHVLSRWPPRSVSDQDSTGRAARTQGRRAPSRRPVGPCHGTLGPCAGARNGRWDRDRSCARPADDPREAP